MSGEREPDTLDLVKAFLIKAARKPTETVSHFLGQTIWRWDLTRMTRLQRLGVLVLRSIYLIGRAFASRRAQLQAMALTYTTMLALVPAVAIVVSLFSIRGLEEARGRLETFIFQALAASPEQERVLSEQLINLSQGLTQSRGIAGLAFLVFLFLTIVSLLSTLERTLNMIWGIKRSRSFISKFMTYWCIATLGPLSLGVALAQGSNLEYQLYSLTDWSTSWIHKAEPEPSPSPQPSPSPKPSDLDAFGFGGVGGAVASELDRRRQDKQDVNLAWVLTGVQRPQEQSFSFLAFLLTTLTFTLLYAFMPNTKVHLVPALAGGFTATTLWTGTKWGLALSSSMLVKYDTVYGSLATIPITMVWLFMTWLIVILGAELTFAIQNVDSQRMEELAADTTTLCKEIVALRLSARICQAFDHGRTPPSVEQLAGQLKAPHSLVAQLLFHLSEDGILREIDIPDAERGFVPARPLDQLSLNDVIESLRERAGVAFDLAWGEDLPVLSEHLGQANAAFESLARRISMRDVVRNLERREREEASHPHPELAAVSAVAAKAIASASISARSLRAKEEAAESPAAEADAAAESEPPTEPEPPSEPESPAEPQPGATEGTET